MTNEDVTILIADYLRLPPSQRPFIVEELAQSPEPAFRATLGFCGPYPESIHPRDAHDHLVDLLTELLRKCPALFIECQLGLIVRSQRYPLIYAAISTHSPQFTDKIIEALKDRSIYIKTLVIDAISRYSYLRTPTAKQYLNRLLTIKSIAQSDFDRDRVEKALAAFTD